MGEFGLINAILGVVGAFVCIVIFDFLYGRYLRTFFRALLSELGENVPPGILDRILDRINHVLDRLVDKGRGK